MGPRETRVKIPAILTKVGFPVDRRTEPMENLSRGMQQKVALARALLTSPVLLLLDEPTTGLDPIGTREMKDLILSLKAQGKTVLLPIFDQAGDTGSNAWYHLQGYAAFHLTGYDFVGDLYDAAAADFFEHLAFNTKRPPVDDVRAVRRRQDGATPAAGTRPDGEAARSVGHAQGGLDRRSANALFGDLLVHVRHSLAHALAEEPVHLAIPQLVRAGAPEVAEAWGRVMGGSRPNLDHWEQPATSIAGEPTQ